MAKKLKPASEVVSKSGLAKALGVSPGRITQLIKMGLPVRSDGKVDLAAASKWYRDRIRQPAGRQPIPPAAPDSLAEAQRRREWIRLQREQLELARAQAEVLDAAEVREAWLAVAAKIRDAVLGIPSRVVLRLPSEWRARVLDVVEHEARQVLTALSQEVPRL